MIRKDRHTPWRKFNDALADLDNLALGVLLHQAHKSKNSWIIYARASRSEALGILQDYLADNLPPGTFYCDPIHDQSNVFLRPHFMLTIRVYFAQQPTGR